MHLLHTNGEKTPSVVPESPKPIKGRGLRREVMKRIREENTKYLAKAWWGNMVVIKGIGIKYSR